MKSPNTKSLIFNNEQAKKAKFILENNNAKLSSLNSSELKKLPVVWSYYSGKIEGNTYTYVETEALLIDGVTSQKKYEDAKMLKNLHNTFTTALKEIRDGNHFDINSNTIITIHSELASGLVEDKERGIFRQRPVKISGTNYVPPADETMIRAEFEKIIKEKDKYLNPLEKAIFLHCNLARIQPFIDGNKRTSRLVESIVTMQHDIIPTYSSKDEDILEYRKALVHFYETEDYSQYADYVLNRHIERINQVSLDTEPKFNL